MSNDAGESAGFRDFMSRFASGVTVVSTMREGAPIGTTATAVCSVSLEPSLVLVCIGLGGAMDLAVERSKRLFVNILSDRQLMLQRFSAGPGRLWTRRHSGL